MIQLKNSIKIILNENKPQIILQWLIKQNHHHLFLCSHAVAYKLYCKSCLQRVSSFGLSAVVN